MRLSKEGRDFILRFESVLNEIFIQQCEDYLTARFESLPQNQFDSLVDFMHNVGIFESYGSELFLQLDFNPDTVDPYEFDRWIYNRKGRKSESVKNRSIAERLLFTTGVYKDDYREDKDH
ncbi:hypothetical protein UFOVP81_3 [uncultured Caudovirales phage]|uniref:Lysozyme n=1 Tax=uncultured Caudovirales phage TaxID=2100421 RepID=A0A6J5L3F0_9CAUD|nr:hypothetical protein UFOVP81_3 [uncultured Caudovirales phage]